MATRCIKCNEETNIPRKGLCCKCYSKLRYDTDEKYREKLRINNRKYIAQNREKMRLKSKTHSRTLRGKYTATKHSAKKRGVSFDISLEDFQRLLDNNSCHYCSGSLPETCGGLDRLDNNKGYEASNLVPCCKECNRIKGNQYSGEETAVMVKALKDYRNGQRSK